MSTHTFLIAQLTKLKETLERKIARLDQMKRTKGVQKSTQDKIENKRTELDKSIKELERLIDRLRIGL